MRPQKYVPVNFIATTRIGASPDRGAGVGASELRRITAVLRYDLSQTTVILRTLVITTIETIVISDC